MGGGGGLRLKSREGVTSPTQTTGGKSQGNYRKETDIK